MMLRKAPATPELSYRTRKAIRLSVDILTVVVVVACAHFFFREVMALIAYGCWKELDHMNGGDDF